MSNKTRETNFFLTQVMPSDQWYIEDDRAWFLSLASSELFKVDLGQNIITRLDTVPEHVGWRMVSRCLKYKSLIYCLPDFGEHIWRYNQVDSSWKKIELPFCKDKRYAIDKFWKIGEKVLLLAGRKK